jgi:hypothetical protein
MRPNPRLDEGLAKERELAEKVEKAAKTKAEIDRKVKFQAKTTG